MGMIVTSLNETYQQNEWSVRDAIREIISNAIDGEVRNKGAGKGKMTIDYNARSQNLSVSNEGVVVPTSALLMGMSESRSYDECIGRFGEGLLMALLVLARTNTPTYIENNDEKWEPEIVYSDEYQARVLVIHTRKLHKPRTHFMVRIGDITAEQYQNYTSLFLRFDKRFDSAKVLTEVHGKKQILLQPEFKGCIYNLGVFVQKRTDLLYGYNLDMKLNRDRNFVDEWNLRDALHGLLSTILNETSARSPEAFGELVLLLMTSSDSVETRHGYGDLVYHSVLAEDMERRFVEKHGDAIPVETQEEADEVTILGKTAVITSALVRTVLGNRDRSLSKLRDTASRQPKRVYKVSELEPQLMLNLQKTMARIKPMMTKSGPLKIVDIHGDANMVYDKAADTILINHKVLDQPALLLHALISGAISRELGFSNRSEETRFLLELVLKDL